jgi:kumamolisin
MAILKGSEKHAHPDAHIHGRSSPGEGLTVTIVPKVGGDVRAVENHYSRHFTVTHEHGNLKVRGLLADHEAEFGVRLHQAVLPDGTHFRSRVGHLETTTSITVPDSLAPHIVAVLGLDSRPFAVSHIRPHAGPTPAAVQTPSGVSAFYGYPDVSGAGVTVGIVCLGGGYTGSDLQQAGINPNRVTFAGIDGGTNQYSGNPNSADGENYLDLTVILSGSGLSAKFFEGPNTDQAFYDIAAAILADSGVACGSCSWGGPENQWSGQSIAAWNQLFAGATKPFFSASGDNGINDNTNSPVADFPSAGVGPGAIGVGGTFISGGSERVWDNGLGGGQAGGGFSSTPAPSWQLGSPRGRGVPDISLNADPNSGYILIIGGRQVGPFGGTSAAAPMAARGYALMYSVLGKHVMPLAPTLYAHEATFNQIGGGIQGEYGVPGQVPGAGLGSWNLTRFMAALGPVNPTETIQVSLSASPASPSAGLQFSVTAVPTGVTGSNPTSFSWKDDGGPFLSTSPTATMTYTAAGTYTISCTVTDTVTGVSGTGTLSVTVQAVSGPNPIVVVISGPSTGTVGTPVSFSAQVTSGGPAVRYAWDDGVGDGEIGASPSYAPTFKAAGTYTISVTVSDANGNSDNAETSVVISGGTPPPPPQVGPLEQFGQYIETSGNIIESDIPIDPSVAIQQAQNNIDAAQAWMPFFQYMDSLLPQAVRDRFEAKKSKPVVTAPPAPEVP